MFTPAMRNEVLAELDAREQDASPTGRRSSADDLSKFLQPQWYQARERLDAARADDDRAKLPALAAEVQAKDLAQQLADYEIGINVAKVDRSAICTRPGSGGSRSPTRRYSSVETAAWIDETQGRPRTAAGRRGDAPRQESKASQKQLDTIEKKLQARRHGRRLAPLLARQSRSESLEAAAAVRARRALAELEPAQRASSTS